jgi:hypothetical protein
LDITNKTFESAMFDNSLVHTNVGKDQEKDMKKFKINHLYLIHLAFCMGIGDMNLGCAIDTAGNLDNFIRAQIITKDQFGDETALFLQNVV